MTTHATHEKTDEIIRASARHLFARRGYDGVSMRILSKETGVGLSSIYHFFADKDALLTAVYHETNQRLGQSRKLLKNMPSAEKMLSQIINFQFDHIEDVVFVCKYYMHYRDDFAKLSAKTLPPKAILHIEEVLHKGIVTGEFKLDNQAITMRAKIVAHTINGFLLEYYPYAPNGRERKVVIDEIVDFSMRALV